MRPRPVFVLAILAVGPVAASAQTIYRCASPNGAVTYQETPCPAKGSEKRVDTTHGDAADPVARKMLEREAYRGDPLAREFVLEARERERQAYLERREREERARLERLKESRPADEPPVWDTPWGWPGPPGLARPKPKPAS
ncbi:MAG: DUF4124 domain-containing protein [Betaproteobacteria bacterium]|nr:DUF4124 domain-containing protein [Betaproteobacteria bacterium]